MYGWILTLLEMSDIFGGDKAYLGAGYRIFLAKMSYIFTDDLSAFVICCMSVYCVLTEVMARDEKKQASDIVRSLFVAV